MGAVVSHHRDECSHDPDHDIESVTTQVGNASAEMNDDQLDDDQSDDDVGKGDGDTSDTAYIKNRRKRWFDIDAVLHAHDDNIEIEKVLKRIRDVRDNFTQVLDPKQRGVKLRLELQEHYALSVEEWTPVVKHCTIEKQLLTRVEDFGDQLRKAHRDRDMIGIKKELKDTWKELEPLYKAPHFVSFYAQSKVKRAYDNLMLVTKPRDGGSSPTISEMMTRCDERLPQFVADGKMVDQADQCALPTDLTMIQRSKTNRYIQANHALKVLDLLSFKKGPIDGRKVTRAHLRKLPGWANVFELYLKYVQYFVVEDVNDKMHKVNADCQGWKQLQEWPESTMTSINRALMEPTFGCAIERIHINKHDADKSTWGLRMKWFDPVGFPNPPEGAKSNKKGLLQVPHVRVPIRPRTTVAFDGLPSLDTLRSNDNALVGVSRMENRSGSRKRPLD